MRAVFLDRDGTLIEDKNYLSTPLYIRFLPGVLDGLRLLKDSGFELFIVTNQSGVSRGFLSLERLFEIHRELIGRLKGEGISIKEVHFCPHHPGERCGCRKPGIHMLLRIKDRYPEIDFGSSFIIGDRESDILLGKNLGLKTVFVGGEVPVKPDYTAENFYDASLWITRSVI
jgi:histidinol-phosphate phosphatase family protein